MRVSLRTAPFLVALATASSAQDQTVGVFLHDPRAEPGYTLFAPMRSTTTYLIDSDGRQVHSWASAAQPGASVNLLPDGSLLRLERVPNSIFRAGGAGGAVRVLDWDGSPLWEFVYASTQHLQHHDAVQLPNGNVVFIAWERKTSAEAIAAGRNPALLSGGELWPDHLIEVQPSGLGGATVVWEWHVWDHLIQDFDPTKANYGVVADRAELVDLNFAPTGGGADWNHANGIAYHAGFDQIVLSVHNLSEIWVIDHGTTTAEAAGHTGGRRGKGGDLLYRWGNPASYRVGTAADRMLYSQHDATWIAAGRPGEGNLLVFNNGLGRPGGNSSSVDELAPPVDAAGDYSRAPGTPFGPAALTWSYSAPVPGDFFAQNISGAERLAGGSTLICEGPEGNLFEVTPGGETIWHYLNPVIDTGVVTQGDPIPGGAGGRTNTVFKVRRYAPGYPGLAGRSLAPGPPVEPYVLMRNLDLTSIAPPQPPLASLFPGTLSVTLDPVADRYLAPFVPGDADADPVLCGLPPPPLVFYQINSRAYVLQLAREPACTFRFRF